VIAGATLLSARPFRVADRVRIQGVGIDVEGTVATLGLFYTTLISGADRILIPNSVLMSTAVMPLNEPDPVRVRARFDSSRVTPAMIQAELEEQISVPLMRAPEILLDEIDADGDSSFEITSTPEFSGDGAQLAAEVLTAIARRGGEGDTDPKGEPAVDSDS
jgi:small-conductance mechanosensitive channel